MKGLAAWFLAGLVLRLVLSPLHGTQDVEWQKAWGTAAVRDGLLGLYGAKDAEILALRAEGVPRDAVRAATQTVIPFEPHRYSRTEYRVTYPPLYLYGLYGEAKLYAFFSPEMKNGRGFNVAVNILPILASAALALVLASFAANFISPAAGTMVGLAYWLNPVILLNSPVQGYQDPMCALFAVLAVFSAFRRRIGWACVLLVLGVMIKPQAVLVAPVVLWAGWLNATPAKNLRAWIAGIATLALVLAPYLLAGRGLSVMQGVLSITDSSHDISRQALNLWWPLQYTINAFDHVREGGGVIAAIAGGWYPWFDDVPAARVALPFGLSLHALGLTAFAIFTVFNLRQLARRREDAFGLLEAAALQVYAYFILCVGVQINHYQILIPFLMVLAARRLGWRLPIVICAVFLAQDLIFYGLGRDFNYGKQALAWAHLGWTTVLLAFLNVVLFVALARRVFRGAPTSIAGVFRSPR